MSNNMRLNQAVRKYVPPQAIHLGKYVLNPNYRHRERELARLNSLPRYKPTVTDLLSKPVEIVDSASFLYTCEDIFEQQIYRFHTNLTAPYIIDGGANIGLIILYFKGLYPESRIVAFEPDEQLFSVLERNIQRWGYADVETIRRALWSSETQLGFMSDGADAGRIARAGDPKNAMTQTVRLRNYLDRPVSLLKLDIEGAETEVLNDCANLLGNVENLFLEYHSFLGEPQTLNTIVNILTEAGFRLHIQPVNPSPQPFIRRYTYLNLDLQLNIFAFR